MRGEFNLESNDNTLFTTSQCNNNCIMCCQPPLKVDDIDELYQHNVEIIKSAPKGIPVVGISGGEPALLGNCLIELIELIRKELPNSDIHLLTNGRLFKDSDYTQKVVKAADGKLIAGIPLHSDYFQDHDIIAGAKRAYYETIAGIFNLAALGATIELRIVINRLNYNRLPQMADFIHKNLPFVAWTAFMAMEHVGNAIKNEHHIWIEPQEYIHYLSNAVKIMYQWNMDVSIYNIPLCLLPDEMHVFARQSVSDWKTKYLEICNECTVKNQCCGLFATSKRIYKGLKTI